MSTLGILVVKYLIGLAGISAVVLIHEAGHLVFARLCGIGVEVFSFGFGPKLIGFQLRGIEVRLSMLPVGGYCRLKGSEDLNRALRYKSRSFKHTEEGSYFGAHPAKRILTYLGGVLFNITFAVLLYAALATLPFTIVSTAAVVATTNDYESLFGENTSPAWQAGLRSGDLVTAIGDTPIHDWEELEAVLANASPVERFYVDRDGQPLNFLVHAEQRDDRSLRWGLAVLQETVVGSVRSASREERAGLLSGDRITGVNGMEVANHLDLLALLPTDGQAVALTVERGTELLDISYRPELDEGGKSDYRFSLASGHRSGIPGRFKLSRGIEQSVRVAEQTVQSLSLIPKNGSGGLHSSVTGMTRSALLIGDIASLGFEQSPSSGIHGLLYLMGIVSISLAIINLAPLPAFDGGQVAIALFEWVVGKPIRPRVYLALQITGLVMIVLFFLLLSFSDFRYMAAIRR